VARNTNRQGAAFELAVMHYLAGTLPEKWGPGFGYDCARSSGSRGKVDVWAVGPETGEWARKAYGLKPELLFIQAKCNIKSAGLSPAERIALMDLALRAGAVPMVAYQAKDKTTGRVRPHFRQLTGPGPREWVQWEPGEDD
jgi:hypothetical protein